MTLAHLDSWPLIGLLTHFDSWATLTLPFVSFLLFTVTLTLSGSKQQQPIFAYFDFFRGKITETHLDTWLILNLPLVFSCCSLLVELFHAVNNKSQY